MKIKKNEFKVHLSKTKEPLLHIESVTYPFTPQIVSNKIKVFISIGEEAKGRLITADWKSYELILFNVIQNAVKYNSQDGNIVILANLRTDQNKAYFRTQVIDTGEGITEDRQAMLFKPFMELRIKQNFDKVKDKTTGIGLSCSYDITTKLNGHLCVTHSEPGLTIFTIEIPVEIVEES